MLTHTVGTKSWIKDNAEGWIKCDVVKVDPGLLTVKTERGDVLQAKPEDCPLQNPLARAGVEVGPLACLPTCPHSLSSTACNCMHLPAMSSLALAQGACFKFQASSVCCSGLGELYTQTRPWNSLSVV